MKTIDTLIAEAKENVKDCVAPYYTLILGVNLLNIIITLVILVLIIFRKI